MFSSCYLLSAILLSSPAAAFYPWSIEADVSTTGAHKLKLKERFYPLSPDALKLGENGELTLDLKRGPRMDRRDNRYVAVNGSQPSAANSLAINNDGHDYSYFSYFSIGSSGRQYWMLLDSGAANTWVMGSDCTSKPCTQHNTFGDQDSSSVEVTTTPWSVSYGSGNVEGVLVNDTISFLDYKLEMTFGSASKASDDFNNYPFDGIIGLGRPGDSEKTTTVMEMLSQAKLLKANVVGISLQRTSDKATDGQITFGAVDQSKYIGQIVYTDTTTTGDRWEIPADDAGVDGKSIGFSNKTAIIDTGTSLILMPPDDAAKIHDLIPGSQPVGSYYQLPCSSTAVVHYTFSGITYSVSPKDYLGTADATGQVCLSNIIGHQAFGPDEWLLGDVFLKNVYTVLDFDTNQVGFAGRDQANPPTTNAAASSSIAAMTSTMSGDIPLPTSEATITSPAVAVAAESTTGVAATKTGSAARPQTSLVATLLCTMGILLIGAF